MVARPRDTPPTRETRPAPRRGGRKRRITSGLAILLAVMAFAAGVVVGWAGRGGPADPVLVTTSQEIPLVTVTQTQAP